MIKYIIPHNSIELRPGETGSEGATDNQGLIRGKGGAVLGLKGCAPYAFPHTRSVMLCATGADLYHMVYCSSPYPGKLIWAHHGMRCDVCGRAWNDGVRLVRHHKIPLRLCRQLGLSPVQSAHRSNLAVLCEEDHDEADRALRAYVRLYLPLLYCWGVR